MKKLVILLFLITIINCDKDTTSINAVDKFFDPQKIEQLSIEEYDGFWQGESIKNVSENITGIFNNHPEFLAGKRYSSENKNIVISVFQTKEAAIHAMEGRINNVACVILPGNSNDLFKSKWWFTDCIPNGIFVNQWNTIIELGYYHSNYSEIEDFMIQSAAELAHRVDSLSE